MKKVILFMSLALGCLCFVGCQSAESINLQNKVATLTETIADKQGKIQDLYQEFEELKTAKETGELSIEYIMDRAPAVLAEIPELIKEYDQARTEMADVSQAIKELSAKEGQGMGETAVTVLMGLLVGVGSTLAKGKGNKKAIGELITSIASTTYTKQTKKMIADLDNPAIQKQYKKFKAAEKAKVENVIG